MKNRTPVARADRAPLPDFAPVPRQTSRHDGWTPERQRAFIEALADTGSVSRAAAIHELGHIIAHHESGGDAIFERAGQIGSFGESSRRESFVDAFASCLLLPDVGVGKALQAFREHYGVESRNITDLEVLAVARFYGVSFDVVAHRCEDLRLLPRGAAFAISQSLKKQYGSAEKRAEYLGLPPRNQVVLSPISSHLANAISQAVRRGDASIGWVTDRLGLSIGEVLALNAEYVAS